MAPPTVSTFPRTSLPSELDGDSTKLPPSLQKNESAEEPLMYNSEISPTSLNPEPSSNPITLSTSTDDTQILNLTARSRIMGDEFLPTLQSPRQPHSSPVRSSTPLPKIPSSPSESHATAPSFVSMSNSELQALFNESTMPTSLQDSLSREQSHNANMHELTIANLLFNRRQLRDTISLYNNLFPGTTADELLTTLVVHKEKRTLPDIHITSAILEQILRETAWLEKQSFDNLTDLRSFQREENRKMGRELRTLKALIDSYAEIQEDLRRTHGITMSPIELPDDFGDEGYNYDHGEDDESTESSQDDKEVDQSQDDLSPAEDEVQAGTQHLDAKSIIKSTDEVATTEEVCSEPAEEAPRLLLQQEQLDSGRFKPLNYPYITALAIGIAVGSIVGSIATGFLWKQ
ncbi:hypothetical protein TWF281_006103 [Arthrobotrys megalospora]